MSSIYASKMLDLLNRTGQPETSTTTSTGTSNQTMTPPKPGIDIGNLMLMLMMSMMNPKKDTGARAFGTNLSDLQGLPSPGMPGLITSLTPSSIPSGQTDAVASGNSPDLTVQMLMQLLGLGKTRGI